MAPRGTAKGKLQKPSRSLTSKANKDPSYNLQNVKSVSTPVGEPRSMRPKRRSSTPDALHQLGPADDMDPTHIEMTQDQSVKRKRPAALDRVADSVDDATTIQHDKPESGDGTGDYAPTPKRARPKRASEVYEKLNSCHVQASQMMQESLADLEGRMDEAETGLAKVNERHDTLQQAQELHDSDNQKLKVTFANLQEAVFINTANIKEDRKRHDSHKTQADADRAVVSTLAIQVVINEKETAAQLQSRPSREEVTALIVNESNAQEAAMKQSVKEESAACAESLRQGFERSHQKALETMIAAELEPIIKGVDKKLRASAKRDSALKIQVKSNGDKADKTAVAVSAIELQLTQTATTREVEMLLASERKEREEALNQLDNKCTTNLSTQLSAGIETLESKLESVTIPGAVEPLRHEVNVLKEQQTKSLDDFRMMATEMQQKFQADHDRMAENASRKFDERVTETTGLIDQKFTSQQQELVVDRQRSNNQFDLFRAAIKKFHMDATAKNDGCVKRLDDIEKARAEEKAAHAVERATQAEQMAMMARELDQLRSEFHADRVQGAAVHAALRANDLERIKTLEESQNTARMQTDSLHDTVKAQTQDLRAVHDRLSKLETTVSQLEKIQKELESLKSTVDSMLTATKALEGHRVTIQNSTHDCVAVNQSDFDLLKHQVENHIAHQTTTAHDQTEAMKTHANQVERQVMETQEHQKCVVEMKEHKRFVADRLAEFSDNTTNLEAQIRILRGNIRC